MRRRSVLVLAVTSAAALVACDTDDGRQLREPTSEQRAAMTTTTSSTSVPVIPPDAVDAGPLTTLGAPTTVAAAFTLQAPWPSGGTIDVRFTCDGEDVSPALSWTAPPAGTVELALVVSDDDAGGFVHWAVGGIPVSAGAVSEGGTIAGVEGRNDFGRPGWGGPCPPSGLHLYRFSLYALGQEAELPDDFTGEDLRAVANGASLAVAEVTGTYGSG